MNSQVRTRGHAVRRYVTPGLLLKISAIYLGILGALALLAPDVASAGLGHAMTPFELFATRTIGATLITIAIMNWSASSTTLRPPTGTMLANVFLNATLGAVDIVNIANGTIPADWTGSIIHAVLLTCFVVGIIGSRRRQPMR